MFEHIRLTLRMSVFLTFFTFCSGFVIYSQSTSDEIREIEERLKDIDNRMEMLKSGVDDNIVHIYHSQNLFIVFISVIIILFGALVVVGIFYAVRTNKETNSKTELKLRDLKEDFEYFKKSSTPEQEAGPEQTELQRKYSDAVRLFNLYDYEKAKCVMTDLLDNYTLSISQTAELLFRLARCHEIADDKDSAIEYYNRTIAIKPDNTEALNNKGLLLAEKGLTEEALQCCDNALSINPQMSSSLINKGDILKDMGEEYYSEALKCYNLALKITPENGKVLFNKGLLLSKLSKKHYIEAIECFDGSLNIDSDNWEVLTEKALLLKEMGPEFHADALKCFNKAIFFKPNYRKAITGKGMLLKNMGSEHLYEAVSCLNRALEIKPDDWDVLNSKGILLGNAGVDYFPEALDCFIKASELNPLNETIKKNIATVSRLVKSYKLDKSGTNIVASNPV